MNEIKRKLNVSEYAFEIDGRNIVNCYLSYSVNEYDNIVRYVDGHEESNKESIISIEVNGIDLNTGDESWFSFELKIGLDELNIFSDVPVNIIDKVYDGECFIKRPNSDNSTFLNFEYPKGILEDMYLNISSLWVSKLDDNKFIFKVCVPSEGLFCYFPINFDKK